MKRVLPLLALLAAIAPADGHAKPKKNEPPPAAEPAPPPAPPPDPEAWRATQPPPGQASDWQPPVAKVITLSNGIPVYLVESPGLPLVTVELVMKVGSEANPRPGVAALTASMLDEGTTTRTGGQIATTAAELGANLSTGSSDEAAWVGMDALTGDTLGPSLDLFADVILHPRFDSKVYSRVQSETLADLQDALSDPRTVNGRVFAAQLYGMNHPYGVPAMGTTESVKATKVADVKAFYQTWWHAGNAAFVVSGAVTEAEVKQLFEQRFGTWKAGSTTRKTVAPAAVPLKTRVVFVEQPGAVQSVIRVGTVGVSRGSPDYVPLNLAVTLYGGMFSSRLNINLREEHGWSYGAYAVLSDSRDHSVLSSRTSVQADQTAPAVVEILKEMQAAAKAPSAADLQLSKDYLVKSLAGYFETNSATVSSMSSLPTYGLGPDAWVSWARDTNAVTAEQMGAAAKTWLAPDRHLVVVVGPRTIEVDDGKGGKATVDVVAGLKALGYEFVEVKAPR